jgi:CRP-like cAMP-binding protein
MISPELLRNYPFFRSLDDAQLRAIAIITKEETVDTGVTLFHEGEPAQALYFLKDGCVDLYYQISEAAPSDLRKGISVGEINPGEPFSISALIEPYILSATARVSKPSHIIKIEAEALRDLFAKDQKLAYLLTYQAAKAVIERLHTTRIQLAAVWA